MISVVAGTNRACAVLPDFKDQSSGSRYPLLLFMGINRNPVGPGLLNRYGRVLWYSLHNFSSYNLVFQS